MPARKCRGNSSYRHLAPVRLSLMSRRHSTAAPSPKRYGKRYEVEGRTNFLELRKSEVQPQIIPTALSADKATPGHRAGVLRGHIQNPASELRRILILGTSVNKGPR